MTFKIDETISYRRYVRGRMIPASTLAKYVLSDKIHVTGQQHDQDLLNDLRDLARGYKDVFFEGFFIWYTEDVDHEEYPKKYDGTLVIDGIKIYNQLTREDIFRVVNEFRWADEI